MLSGDAANTAYRPAIVFCRTRLEVEALTETLNAHGYRAEALHGGMAQRDRDRVMNKLRSGKLDLLVATDVAARGLDIEHLSHVVNYDVPSSAELYVHRIGRTGRVGRTGVAITFAEPREHRLLRNIEAFTTQKLEVATVPTVADLRTRRLDVTRANLRERLLAGDFEDTRGVVESLAEEFDIVQIAAAAVKMAHTAANEGVDGDERDIPAAAPIERAHPPSARPGPQGRREKPGPHGTRLVAGKRPGAAGGTSDASRGGDGKLVRLHVGMGRIAGVRPGDLVGAITGEAGVESRVVGAIEIADKFSLVEVPESLADDIVEALRASTIRGKKVTVRRDASRS